MPHKAKWHHIDAVLGKPNHSMQAKLMVCTQAELARWLTKHLEQGYTVTLTKVEQRHETIPSMVQTIRRMEDAI